MKCKYIFNKHQFGLAVRESRLKKQLTQEKLADLLKMNDNMISDIERGVRLPGRDKLFELAGYLNISIDNFINYDKVPTTYDEISKLFIKLTNKQQKFIITVMKFMIELMIE